MTRQQLMDSISTLIVEYEDIHNQEDIVGCGISFGFGKDRNDNIILIEYCYNGEQFSDPNELE